MKAFVTGGAGFIGQRVVRKLVDRGYDVTVLVRSQEDANLLAGMGAKGAIGDITDRSSMHQAMKGSDVVFHLAAWYAYGAVDREQMEIVNVGGTRKVLRLAAELDVPRIIYTSTVNVFGDTKGEFVDETYYHDGPFPTEYDRTKWLAHYKVVWPLIEKGAPITIAMPGPAYGPGDHSIIADAMRMFYRGFPIIPGPDTVLTFTHVDDVAEGIILTYEKGQIGETYILTGPAIPLGEIIDFWSHLTGRPAPTLRVPSSLVRASAPLANLAGPFTDISSVISREGASLIGATFMTRSDKAREELGWKTRPLQLGMSETFAWIAATEDQRKTDTVSRRERQAAGLALFASLILLFAWLFSRRRNS